MSPRQRRATGLVLVGSLVTVAVVVGLQLVRPPRVQAFASAGANPRVAFTVTGLDRRGRLALAVSPYWKARDGEDAEGVAARLGEDGHVYHNISSIGFQAQASRFATPQLDLDVLVGGSTALNERQARAFRWLDAHKSVLGNGGHLWHYDFEYDYNNLFLTTPWPSAFGQAAVIHAMLAAARTTGDDAWLERAKAAALAFDVDADEGGLRDEVDGQPFYEEVALARGYSPHILNGHLYSVVILRELHRATGDPRIGQLADAGVASARATLHLFDQGSWTRYDLRPRPHEVPLCVAVPDGGVERVQSVVLRGPRGSTTVLRLEPGAVHDARATAYGGWTRHADGRGWEVTGPAFCAMALPEAEVRDWLAHPGWTLEVTYRGDAESPPALGALDMRTGLEGGYCRLRSLGVETTGDVQLARYRLGLEDLAWSYLQRYYGEWHTILVRRLYELTGDPVFRRFQARWTGYLDTYDSDIAAHPKHDVPPTAEALFRLTDRVWDRPNDPRLEEAVLQALAGLDTELKPRDMVLALLRFTFQRLALGGNPHSDPGDMLAHGSGSCSQYAAVFQALCREIGLRCRIWNLYEIPVVGGHNLCEVWLEGKWCAMDPGYGAFFTLDADVGSPLASVQQLRTDGAAAATYWELRDRATLPRGRAPAPLSESGVAAVFVAPGRYPSNYPADVIFAARKGGVRGASLLLETSLPVDLGQGAVELGTQNRAADGPAWSGLTSLTRADGVVVSLHELGRSPLHTVAQRFHLSGLEPGRVYGFEADLAYTKRADPRPTVAVDGAEVWAMKPQPIGDGGVARVRAWFRASGSKHDLILSLAEGYALLSALRFAPTPWAGLPRPVSVGARVVDASAFYPGHGPENALDGIWDDDYVAALDGTLPNRFTLELEAPVTAVGLDIVWNSTAEYGRDFALVALTEGGDVPVLEVTGNRPDSGGRSNRYALTMASPARRFRFELRRAAGQDRLLMMDFTLVGVPPR